MNKLRYSMFLVTVFLVLALSAMSTVPALADEGTPPAAEEITPPVEGGSEETPPAEPVSEETPPAELPVTEETAQQEETVEELLASVPVGTEVAVVNEAGETVPLATQEAAEILSTNDPIWCPTGVAPNPGVGGCTNTFQGFNANIFDAGLLSVLSGKTVNGTIWILGSYTGTFFLEGGDVTLDGFSLGTTANFALTIKGGWTGTTAGTIDPGNPSEFNVPLTINNWNNAVTLSDILITGASGCCMALKVGTTKNITLTNVDVVNNTTGDGGAQLDDTGGGLGTGNVVVNDSSFSGNSAIFGIGLEIRSNGTITGKNISVNDNANVGAHLENNGAATPKAVTLTGSNNFKFNGADGLVVYSDGAITLSNVTAIYNSGGFGAYLDNCQYNFGSNLCDQVVPSAVTIKGTSNFSNNGFDGLRVWSGGAITLNNITANDNGTNTAGIPVFTVGQEYAVLGKGAFISNFGAPTFKPVTLTGTNTFNGNISTGLYLDAYGAVKVNNLTANDNGCDLVKEYDKAFCDGAQLFGTAGVTLTGYGTFMNNYNDGLYTSTLGAITWNNVHAEGNDGTGASAEGYGPAGNVSLLGTNTFNLNGDYGLVVSATGAVTLNNIMANANGLLVVDGLGDGVYVDNTAAASARAVILKGTNIFNGNDGTGLNVWSNGAITTNNITALGNDYGVYLNNCYEGPPSVCSTGFTPQPITMTGLNIINENATVGLWVTAWGAVKVNNLNAQFNGDGARIDNQFNDTTGAITLTGYGNLSDNTSAGLRLYSAGAVTLANLTVNNNGGRGVEIHNDFDNLKPANVTLTGLNQFNNNFYSGLEIYSHGSVLLNNITANENGQSVTNGYGVFVDNCLFDVALCTTLTAKPVTLNGINIFNDNYDGGLFATSLGAIKVNKVTANSNVLGSGMSLDNQYDFVNSAITLTGYGIFNDNGHRGLYVSSNGAITMSNLTASFNGNDGANLSNKSDTLLPVTVTLLGSSVFNGNYYDGLAVYSDGQITLNNITANDNINGYGAWLNNTTYAIPLLFRGITLNGANTFVNNKYDGLNFAATGNVILTRITADLNDDGVIDGNYSAGVQGTAGGTISLTCGSMNLNEGAGYDLTAGAGLTVTLKGVFTHANGAGPVSGPITVSTRTCPLP